MSAEEKPEAERKVSTTGEAGGSVYGAVRSSFAKLAASLRSSDETEQVREDLTKLITELFRMVPGAVEVTETTTWDPEDGTAGVHYLIRTSAPVAAVIDAEDRLHLALFERLPAAATFPFSIGYEFIS